MTLPDWVDWSNTGVGGVGLALTLVAIVQATGAKRAARAASAAIYRRNAKDDVERLARTASSILAALETEQYELTLHKARDFMVDCPSVREHHRMRFGREGGRLVTSYSSIAKVSQLHANPEINRDLIRDVQRVVTDLSGLVGILSREIEEEVR